jgi:Uncharacterised nucleotidyltransferase
MGSRRYPSRTEGLSPDEILRESEDFFSGRGAVHTTLRRLSSRLDEEAIPYAILGGMAMNLLGYTRQTVDLDILLTPEGLQRFRERLVGRGYAPAFEGARKTFQDVETGVRIEVLASGDYPGDGRPKPVSFPDPALAAVERGGYRVISLERLVERKLASGLSAPHRELIDFADVQRLIAELRLPVDFGDRLDPSVRTHYSRLWELARKADEERRE